MSKVLLPLALITVLFTPLAAYPDWEEGLAAFNAGEYEEAVDKFREMSRQDPESWAGHYMLGLSLEHLNRREEALQSLQRAYELNPEELGVQLALGRAYFGLQRFGEAEELLSSVDAEKLPAAQQEDFYQLQRDYARALIRKGQISQRETDLAKAYAEAARVAAELVEAGDSYDDYMLRMHAELRAGLYPAAIATGSAAITDPDSGWLAHYYLGLAYFLDGKDQEAAAHLERAKDSARDPRESALATRASELLRTSEVPEELRATTLATAAGLSDPSTVRDILLKDLMSTGDSTLGCPRGTIPCIRFGRPACC